MNRVYDSFLTHLAFFVLVFALDNLDLFIRWIFLSYIEGMLLRGFHLEEYIMVELDKQQSWR